MAQDSEKVVAFFGYASSWANNTVSEAAEDHPDPTGARHVDESGGCFNGERGEQVAGWLCDRISGPGNQEGQVGGH